MLEDDSNLYYFVDLGNDDDADDFKENLIIFHSFLPTETVECLIGKIIVVLFVCDRRMKVKYNVRKTIFL